MPGWRLRSEKAFESSSSKASGARGRFSSHQWAARSIWACARLVIRTLTASSAVAASEPLEHFFGGNGFPAIRLRDGEENLRLLLRTQCDTGFVVSREDGHRASFLESYSLDDHFSADNFSSRYLHDAKNTPIRVLSRSDAERCRSGAAAAEQSVAERRWQAVPCNSGFGVMVSAGGRKLIGRKTQAFKDNSEFLRVIEVRFSSGVRLAKVERHNRGKRTVFERCNDRLWTVQL